ncbi:hypothetical protein D3C87_2164250 [compost metagenome]
MARQDEPRLVCAGAVAYQQTDVLRRVAGRMQHLCDDVAKRQNFLVARSSEWKRNLGVRGKHIFGP